MAKFSGVASAAGLMFLVGVVVLACGGADGNLVAGGDDAGNDATMPPGPSFSEGGAACRTDADCPAGFVCRGVQLGELVQQSCVKDAEADAQVPATDGSSEPDVEIRQLDSGQPDTWVEPDTGPLTDANTGTGNDAANTADAGDAGTCTKELTVTITAVAPNPRPKCYLNTTVDTSSPATLTYPCAGGAATITFGAQVFTGTVTADGVVTLTNFSKYTETGLGVTCEMDATQTISGTLSSGQLTYSYTEVVATAGQSSLCPVIFYPCTGSGPVTVQ